MTNSEKISDLRGKHRNASVLLLGNGPSLRKNDFGRVPSATVLFGTNRSWTEVRAHYHAVSDRVHLEEIRQGKWRPAFLFAGSGMRNWPDDVEGVRFSTIPYVRRGNHGVPVFSEDMHRGVCMGGTPFVALQWIAWMGFSDVFLAGIDLKPDPETGDGHHYPGHRMAPTMLGEQTLSFEIAAEALERLRIRVVNLNPDSALDVWPKVPFEEVCR